MNDLRKFFDENQANLIDKWHHYFDVYDRYFSRYRGTDVHLVEIGVSHGGSLKMWKQYFGPKAVILGADINPDCKKLEEPQVRIMIGDQSDRKFLRSISEAMPRIDILIDDGGHTMEQQVRTFEELFDEIEPNGIYLCEDLHSSYWRAAGGGYRGANSYIEYSKQFIDAINAWHSEDPRKFKVSRLTRSAYALHYYDSMLVIEKRPMRWPQRSTRGVEAVTPYKPPKTPPTSAEAEGAASDRSPLRDDAEIAVVHLVRAANGIEPFETFLDSYIKFPGGVDHDLVILFKGFSSEMERAPYREKLKDIPHAELHVDDTGFDLRAYGYAARHLPHRFLCFLNSFSVVQDEQWLAKLQAAAMEKDVGLVGATGSYESPLSTLALRQKSKTNVRLSKRVEFAWKRLIKSRSFDGFPNPHIRTNAFMIRGDLMREVWPRRIDTREASFAFECGRNGLSRKIWAKGLKVLVVGKDGKTYEKDQWPRSNTFRSSREENLLVADNQTRLYLESEEKWRDHLARIAWQISEEIAAR